MDEDLAFDGLTVFDISQGVAAPYCGMPLPETANPRSHSPHIGQHSREILAELGMADADFDALLADGTVAEPALRQAAE